MPVSGSQFSERPFSVRTRWNNVDLVFNLIPIFVIMTGQYSCTASWTTPGIPREKLPILPKLSDLAVDRVSGSVWISGRSGRI